MSSLQKRLNASFLAAEQGGLLFKEPQRGRETEVGRIYVYLFSCLLQPSDTNNITAYWCHHFTISNEAQKPYIPLYSFIYIIVNTFSLHSELHQTRMKQGSQGWCSVTIWRDGAGRSGRMGEHMYIYLWPIHVDVWQKPSQYCKVIILQVK